MARVNQIWKQYQGTIMGRRIVVEQAIAALFGNGLNDSMRRNAEREAEKLASLVGSYGLGTAARMAREIGAIMASGLGAARMQSSRLLELLTYLRRELDRIPENAGLDDTRSAISVLLIDHTTSFVETASIEAVKLGMNAEVAFDLATAKGFVLTQPIDLILLDLYFPDGREGSLEFVREVSRSHPRVPIIVMSATDTVDDRLEVARAGAMGYLRKTLPVRQLMQLVGRCWQQIGPDHSFHTLLASADEELQQRLTAAFETANLPLQIKMSPQHLWDALSLSNPDVLLVDATMDDSRALDLCRMIRNEARWSTLPILMMGSVDATAARLTGVDDVLPREIEGVRLIESLQSRMRRVQIYRSFGQMDALTGTSSIDHSKQMMTQLLHLSERQKQPFILLVTQLDQIETIRQNEGPGAADIVQHRLAQMLIQFFRAEDVVARWAGDEFVVALFGIDRDRAVGRAAQLLKKITQNPFPEPEWASIPVTLSAGLAQYPVDGETLDALYKSAKQAFLVARENGGNRALRSGEVPAPIPLLERVDVVVVDGNVESIGPVVEALQDDKLTVRWLHSGEEAIRTLTGTSRSLGTSLVLLAAELPDIDGFLVFRQLLREVVVRNVILLANAPSQDQVLIALQLGALDYITRPFDVLALVERVHQALQE